MLTANELGEKGESRFKEICADAQLICNKSDRDLAGWDFIVDFPFKNIESEALDSRQGPTSCHVQVKTLFQTSNRFQMRLSSAERLAKEKKPSFVYVLRINGDLEFVDSFLIHLLDESLAVILKRLRKERSSSGVVKINNKKITLPVNKNSVLLKPTGKDLRAALESACGSDMDGYILKKSRQLQNLGFDEKRHELNVTLHLGSDEEIVDAFLGIRKDIPVSNLQAFETRFGIKLPDHNLHGSGILNINPQPADGCSISFQRSALETPVIFKGEMFNPVIPGLPPEKIKILINSDFFSIELKRSGLQVRSIDGGTQSYAPHEWLKYWNAAHMLAEGKGTLKIIPNGTKQSLNFPISQSIKELNAKTCAYWINVCGVADSLLCKAGVLHKPQVSMKDLERNAIQLLLMEALLKGENYFKSFETEKGPQINELNQIETVCADCVEIGDVILAYYGLLKFNLKHEAEHVKWLPAQFEPKVFENVSDFPKQYEDLIERAKRDTGCQNVISRAYEITKGQ